MTRRREEIINELNIFFALSYDRRNHMSSLVQVEMIIQSDTKKTGTFEKPSKL